MTDASYYLDPDLYDAIYADVVADIEPHVTLMRGAGGAALELACGNGRLLIPTLAAGVPCDGLDSDPRMLASLRAKLAAKGLKTSVIAGDMRDFSLRDRYSLIAIGFNSFLHNLTPSFSLRYVYKPEMELLLRVAGFSSWDVRAAFGSYMDPASIPAGDRPLREGDILEWTAWRE